MGVLSVVATGLQLIGYNKQSKAVSMSIEPQQMPFLRVTLREDEEELRPLIRNVSYTLIYVLFQ